LRIAWLYLAAVDEARTGGDLFAAVRGGEPCTRVVVGDVRSKGLASIGEASVVLGAFRDGDLPELAATLQNRSSGTSCGRRCRGRYRGALLTALVLEIPDQEPCPEMINCSHRRYSSSRCCRRERSRLPGSGR